MANSKIVRHPSSPRQPRKPKIIVSDTVLARSRSKPRSKDSILIFTPPQHPPRVVPVKETTIAQDDDISSSFGWAQSAIFSAFAEGMVFPGYAELSLLAIRAEYRVIAETLSSEMTREWIEFKSTGQEEKTEKIEELVEAVKKYKLQRIIRKAIEHDAFFGRSHIYIDVSDADDRDELKTDIGGGKGDLSKLKVGKGDLKKFKNIELVWCYPTRYNSNDPLQDDWYKPSSWFVM